MYILHGRIELYLPAASSLKDKRQIVQSLSARLRKRFSLSVTEVDHQDRWQRASIGFAAVCKAIAETGLILDAIQVTLDDYDQVEILDFDWELTPH